MATVDDLLEVPVVKTSEEEIREFLLDIGEDPDSGDFDLSKLAKEGF